MKPTESSGQASQQRQIMLSSVTTDAIALGLRRGDVMVALNDTPAPADTASLSARLRRSDQRPHLLTVRRESDIWSVYCVPAQLGRWQDKVQNLPPLPDKALCPAPTRNWDIMLGENGGYDVQPQRPPLLALLTPLYLVQMRLWIPLMVWIAVLCLSIPIGWSAGIALQALMSLYFWRLGPNLVRLDRMARGFSLWRVIAARSERDIHAYVKATAPHLHFVYASGPTQPVPAE